MEKFKSIKGLGYYAFWLLSLMSCTVKKPNTGLVKLADDTPYTIRAWLLPCFWEADLSLPGSAQWQQPGKFNATGILRSENFMVCTFKINGKERLTALRSVLNGSGMVIKIEVDKE